MATVDFTVQLNNVNTPIVVTNVAVSIPTPAGLEFDTVVSGSGYSDLLKQWSIDSVAPESSETLVLRYDVVSGNRWTLEAIITGLDQSDVTQDDNRITIIINPADGAWWLTDTINNADDVLFAYQAVGAASYADSLVNLSNPGTNDLTTLSAPDWSASRGWIFDGVSEYLDTGVVPDGDLTVVWAAHIPWGYSSANSPWGSDAYMLEGQIAGRFDYRYYAAYGVSTHPSGTMALAMHKINTGDLDDDTLRSYRSGVMDGQLGDAVPTGTLVNSDYSMLFGARNSGGSPTNFYNVGVGGFMAYALYQRSLTLTELQEVSQKLKVILDDVAM